MERVGAIHSPKILALYVLMNLICVDDVLMEVVWWSFMAHVIHQAESEKSMTLLFLTLYF